MEYLPIIDEEGNVIGCEDRDTAHEKGLLHMGARVIVKLPDGKIVFQRRSLTKETNPGMLAVTAGGHVQYGQTSQEGAASELLEETGISVAPEHLVYLGKKYLVNGLIKGMPHRQIVYYYGYRHPGTIDDFKVEEKDGDGFVTYEYEEIQNFTEDERRRFSANLFDPDMMEFFKNA